MSRRPPPLLDPLTAADRMADAWLTAHGVNWRWPRMQGAQGAEPGGEVAARDLAAAPADELLEAEQALTTMRAAGRIDAAWRVVAPPATCGDSSDDAPALPVATAAELAGRSLRTVQTHMLGVVEREGAG